jgi:two-component system, cell cycle sensor histidine kinase and response regulator CckA
MKGPTRILILEDVDTDALLIEHELRGAKMPFKSTRVDNREAFAKAVIEFEPDIVLSDFNLPQFSGLEAFRLLKSLKPAVPFILVTGSLTEEVAVECMKEGVHDYILKTSLKRLPSAVSNALDKRAIEEEKTKAESALRKSEELYRLIAENTSDLICMLDVDGKYEYLSPSFRDVLGYDPDALTGHDAFALVHPDDQERVREIVIDETLRDGKPESLEFRFKHSNDEWRIFEAISNCVLGEDDRPERVIVVARDITQRKAAEKALHESEEQLKQSQKLEAIGQLAGGVAHDFNNLLTVITGYADLLVREFEPGSSGLGKIDEIRKAAERAGGLTRQLLAFSRKQVLQPKLFDLNALVSDMGKMLGRLIGEDMDLVTMLSKTPTEVHADPGQIEQVLMNLVVNARDAMPGGGKITIETSVVDIDEHYAFTHVSVKPGMYVMLSVADTGHGMDQDTLKHIFEPFFTTKEQGKGTGLGLSTAYGIIKQSGGNVWVYSEQGIGTTFKVYLPLATRTAKAEEQDNSKQRSVHGSETVLLVEDEEIVRNLGYQVLEMNGYNVLLAKNGEDACRIAREYPGEIHLVVTDVVMPQMGGREVAERITDTRPDVTVLFVSGYTDDAIVRHGILDDKMPFLQKPFSADAFAKKVREVLDAKAMRSDLIASR